MRTILLFDTPATRLSLYPFTLTKPVASIRNGIFTIAERWRRRTRLQVYALTEAYLQQTVTAAKGDYLVIDASCWPDNASMESLLQLKPGETLNDAQGILGYCSATLPAYQQFPVWPAQTTTVANQYRLQWAPQLVQDNQRWMRYDLDLLDFTFQDAHHNSNTIFGDYPVVIHATASVRACIINAEEGAVVIDEGALVMEGSHLRGPVYIGKNAVAKMGTNAYGGTNVGEKCTVGGELKNCILTAFSNKAHEGYLGDSVIGDWCNLGAGTFVSNVKNTASHVRVWHHGKQMEMDAGQKMGCLMGDYSRTAILTAINSGTTIGACCSIHHPMLPEKNIPSFWWGNQQGYVLEKAIADTERWMQLKNELPPKNLRQVLNHIFEQSVKKS